MKRWFVNMIRSVLNPILTLDEFDALVAEDSSVTEITLSALVKHAPLPTMTEGTAGAISYYVIDHFARGDYRDYEYQEVLHSVTHGAFWENRSELVLYPEDEHNRLLELRARQIQDRLGIKCMKSYREDPI